MWFAIYGVDVPGSEALRAPLRAAHIERREALNGEGRILASGPLSDQAGKPYSGTLLIADFPSLDAARAWAMDDPYAKAGVYAELVIKHFNKHFSQGDRP